MNCGYREEMVILHLPGVLEHIKENVQDILSDHLIDDTYTTTVTPVTVRDAVLATIVTSYINTYLNATAYNLQDTELSLLFKSLYKDYEGSLHRSLKAFNFTVPDGSFTSIRVITMDSSVYIAICSHLSFTEADSRLSYNGGTL